MLLLHVLMVFACLIACSSHPHCVVLLFLIAAAVHGRSCYCPSTFSAQDRRWVTVPCHACLLARECQHNWMPPSGGLGCVRDSGERFWCLPALDAAKQAGMCLQCCCYACRYLRSTLQSRRAFVSYAVAVRVFICMVRMRCSTAAY